MIIYLQMLEDLSDRDKFTLLYNKYRRLMLYVANQILNNQDDSEDAVHEAFLSIIRNIKKIQDTDRPVACCQGLFNHIYTLFKSGAERNA